jgi:hypothetical protein
MTNTPTPTPNNKSNLKKAGIIAAAAVLVLGTGALAFAMWPTAVPKADAPVADIVKFAATEKFQNLSADQKKPYIDAMEKLDWDARRKAVETLPEDQRREAFGNIMQAAMTQRVESYFSIQDPAARKKYLDEQIDEMEKRRAQFANMRPPGSVGGERPQGDRPEGNRPPGGNRPDAATRQKSRLERTSPETRQKMAEFFAAIQERRAERGLPEMRGPGMGGGGGGRPRN